MALRKVALAVAVLAAFGRGDAAENPPADTTLTNFADSADCTGTGVAVKDEYPEIVGKEEGEHSATCTAWVGEQNANISCVRGGFPVNVSVGHCCHKADGSSVKFGCQDHCFVYGEGEAEIDWAAIDLMDDGGVGPGIIMEFLILFYCFIGLGLVCDEYLTPALETLCLRFNIRADVAGATFMAVGSAAPEIVINMIAVGRAIGTEDPEAIQLGVSAVLGSGMVSFLLSTGVCAFFAEDDLILPRRPLLRDIGSYALAVCFLAWFFDDGTIELWEALTLVALYIVYLLIVGFSPSIRQCWRTKVQGKAMKKRISFVAAKNGLLDDEEDDELLGVDEDVEDSPYDDGLASNKAKSPRQVTINEDANEAEGDDEDDEDDEVAAPWLTVAGYPLQIMFKYTIPVCEEGTKWANYYPYAIFASFAWIGIWSFLLSTLISRWSVLMGIPTIILGATMVAMGGEVPDTIQSISVAKRGYGSLAVANCLGSKVANVGLGLGMSWSLSSALGHDVKVCNAGQLQMLALFHAAAIILFFVLTLCEAWVMGKNKATLGRGKGLILILAYPVIVGSFIIYTTFL